MRIGEVSLLTNDVIRLANFYKTIFGIDAEYSKLVEAGVEIIEKTNPSPVGSFQHEFLRSR